MAKRSLFQPVDGHLISSPGLMEAPVLDLMCSHFVLTLAARQGAAFNVRRDFSGLRRYARDGLHDCRVISLDWGPWGGGGMVSAELEREYARRGIGLVDPADGVMALLHEVAAGSGPSQLVVMRGAPEAFAPPVDHTPASDDLVAGPRA